MFDTTLKVLPYSLTDVILPHSEKVRSSQDIEKVERHIKYLTAQLPHRNTHGGKAFRAKKISLQNQISLASARLTILQMAKAAPPRKESNMLKSAGTVTALASRTFDIPRPSKLRITNQSSDAMFAGKKRTFTVISTE